MTVMYKLEFTDHWQVCWKVGLWAIKPIRCPKAFLPSPAPSPHTGLWNMWHFAPNGSFHSKMDPKLSNLILKILRVGPKTFQIFMFWISEVFLEAFERFCLECSNFANFWAGKTKIQFLYKNKLVAYLLFMFQDYDEYLDMIWRTRNDIIWKQ